MNLQNVLIALDLTEDADHIIGAARDFIGDSGAAVTLISVVEPLSYAYTGIEAAPAAQALMNLTGEAEKACRAKLNELAKSAGFENPTCQILTGHPASEITALADQIKADIIIVGSHARHGAGLILGSTANAVLHRAHTNVLTVRL
jgi:universal stress protein A